MCQIYTAAVQQLRLDSFDQSLWILGSDYKNISTNKYFDMPLALIILFFSCGCI